MIPTANFQQKVAAACKTKEDSCRQRAQDELFCQLLQKADQPSFQLFCEQEASVTEHAAKKMTSQMSIGSHVAQGRLRANQRHESSSHQQRSESAAHRMFTGSSHPVHRQQGHFQSA